MSKQPIAITSYTITTSLGEGLSNNRLANTSSGLQRCDFDHADHLNTWIGRIKNLEDVVLPPNLTNYECRNHKLALLALEQDGFVERVAQAVQKYGANRVAVIVGTSTSGIEQTEQAYRHASGDRLPEWYRYYDTHNVDALSRFVSVVLGLSGYRFTVSTACSSSAKVFACAERAIQGGLCDAAVVGGVDSLCLTTLCGFNALQLTSEDPCRPCDVNRDGISVGEAGGYALLERANDLESHRSGLLAGFGESADAYHMSSPHPEGKGAYMAMSGALTSAGLEPADIGYVNLHGTGTPANDEIECSAVVRLVGDNTPCSSTKAFTGHTLGACGIVDVAYCLDALHTNTIPANQNLNALDPLIQANVVRQAEQHDVNHVLSNAFGFGGSNCSLVLSR